VTGEEEVTDLVQVIVSEEIRRVRRERWSGVLAMSQGEVTKGLYFVDGEIAFAVSTVEEDRLGANLFRIGRITESQFRAALALAQEPGRRLGQALIDGGILTPGELAAAVTGQVERIVLSVLRWTSGGLQRRAMDRPIPADLALDLNTPRLLLLGARRFPDAARLEQALGPPETRLRRMVPRPYSYDALPRAPAERAVLALCAREASLGDVLRLPPHSRANLARATYALVAGELLEPLPPASRVQLRVEAPSPPTRLAEPRIAEEAPPAIDRPADPSTRKLGRVEREALSRGDWALVPSDEPPEEPEVLSRRDWALVPSDEPPDESEAPEPELPPDSSTVESRAQSLLERGQRAPAIDILTSLLEREPDAHGCRRLLAMTLAQASGFRPEVERHFLTALDARPRDTELRYRLAIYYRRAGMRARAILQLRLVLSADSSHAAAWRDLGELEAGEGHRGR
jgi:tetratricopeptide (TPR) repeat protein